MPLRLSSNTGLVAVALALAALGCRGTVRPPESASASRCDLVPPGAAIAFIPEVGIETAGFEGTVIDHDREPATTLSHIQVRIADGSTRRIGYQIPKVAVAANQGEALDFHVEHHGRFPSGSALVIRDAAGLRFAAVSDIAVGSLVLEQGLPGFRFELLPTSCENRAHDECDASVRNRPLRVEHEGKRVDLYHGESATLGDYRIDCLLAQQVEPSGRCSEAGALSVSYVVSRIPK